MKKYIFFIFIINVLQTHLALSCPCEFSPEDERPFFEQYEVETNNAEKKDKS